MKKYTNYLIAGQFTLVAGILLHRITPITPIIDFLSGMFIGLSIVFNIATIVYYRLQLNKS